MQLCFNDYWYIDYIVIIPYLFTRKKMATTVKSGLCSSRFVQTLTTCIRTYEILKAVESRYDCTDYLPFGAKPHCRYQNIWLSLYCTRRSRLYAWLKSQQSRTKRSMFPLYDYFNFAAKADTTEATTNLIFNRALELAETQDLAHRKEIAMAYKLMTVRPDKTSIS